MYPPDVVQILYHSNKIPFNMLEPVTFQNLDKLTVALITFVAAIGLVVVYLVPDIPLKTCISSRKFWAAFIPALMIISAVILTDSHMDRGLKTVWGPALFVLGWLLLAFLVAPTTFEEDKPNGSKGPKDEGSTDSYATWDWKKALYIGIPAVLVMVAAMSAQKAISTGYSAMMKLMVLFALAWLLFGFSLGVDIKKNDKGDQKVDVDWYRSGWSMVSGMLIVVAMYILFHTRKLNIKDGGQLTGNPQTFTPGLPLFTLGWVGIMIGMSKTPC
jgi:hypothetical protein